MFAQDVSVFVALFAGFASFASPCILPLIPAYISYISGSMDLKDTSFINIMSRSIAFILGFSIIFIALGASASFLGSFLTQYRTLFLKVSGILVIIFGLHMMEIIKIPFLYRQVKFEGPENTASLFGAVLLGMAFAAGWSPCVGPVLSSILIYAGSAATVSKGIYLLSAYSLGLAIPFLLAAVLMYWFGLKTSKLNKYTPVISKVSGVIMIILGILLFFDYIAIITEYLYRIF